MSGILTVFSLPQSSSTIRTNSDVLHVLRHIITPIPHSMSHTPYIIGPRTGGTNIHICLPLSAGFHVQTELVTSTAPDTTPRKIARKQRASGSGKGGVRKWKNNSYTPFTTQPDEETTAPAGITVEEDGQKLLERMSWMWDLKTLPDEVAS